MHCLEPMITQRKAEGVTLVELIVVIAITSIIGAMVAIFIRRPVEGYADAARRASLTDEADTALRRMTRDLRLALPNSVRVDASGQFVEYIETTGGGRYRAELDSGGGGNILDFATADTTFDVLGPVPALGNHIVVYNLYNSGTTSNAYFGDNRAVFSSVSAPTITIAAVTSLPFPVPSPAKRFHVVSGPVTYGCTGGQLLRYSGYAYSTAQVAPPAGATTTAILAANVDTTSANRCQFVYTAGALSERIATVSIFLPIVSTSPGGNVESVRMFQQTQVSNAP